MRSLTLPDAEYRALAHRLSDFTAGYLESLPNLPSYPQTSGDESLRLFGGDLPLDGIGAQAFDALGDVFAHSRPASPRFFGYVFGTGEPIGALGQFASAVLHQNATAWRSGPSTNIIERIVVRWLAEREASAEAAAANGVGKPADDGALDDVCRGPGAPRGGVLMEHGRRKLAERPDGLAGAEDVSEEAR